MSTGENAPSFEDEEWLPSPQRSRLRERARSDPYPPTPPFPPSTSPPPWHPSGGLPPTSHPPRPSGGRVPRPLPRPIGAALPAPVPVPRGPVRVAPPHWMQQQSEEGQPAEIPVSRETMQLVVKEAVDKLNRVTAQEIADYKAQLTGYVAQLTEDRQARNEAEFVAECEREARRTAEALADSFQKQVQCLMCFDKERKIMFQPCFHFISCTVCQHKVSTCPLCRAEIKGRLEANLA